MEENSCWILLVYRKQDVSNSELCGFTWFGRGKLGIFPYVFTIKAFSRIQVGWGNMMKFNNPDQQPGHSGRSHTNPSHCGEFKVIWIDFIRGWGLWVRKDLKAPKLVVLVEAVFRIIFLSNVVGFYLFWRSTRQLQKVILGGQDLIWKSWYPELGCMNQIALVIDVKPSDKIDWGCFIGGVSESWVLETNSYILNQRKQVIEQSPPKSNTTSCFPFFLRMVFSASFLRAVQCLKSSQSLISKFSLRLVDVELVDLSVEILLQAEDEVCGRVVAWRITPLKWLVKGVTSHL